MRGIMAGLVFHHLAMPISQYELKAKRMPAFSLFLLAFLPAASIVRLGSWSIKSAGFSHCAECTAFGTEMNILRCQCIVGGSDPLTCQELNLTGHLCHDNHYWSPHDHCLDCGGAVLIVLR